MGSRIQYVYTLAKHNEHRSGWDFLKNDRSPWGGNSFDTIEEVYDFADRHGIDRKDIFLNGSKELTDDAPYLLSKDRITPMRSDFGGVHNRRK